MSRSRRPLSLPAPYLRRIWLDPERIPPGAAARYPFGLPLFQNLDLAFDTAVTIVTGENGSGKSTLLEAIAVLTGFDEAGGAAGHRPVNHQGAVEATGGELATALKASWLPKLNTGWFFKAESFFSVARYVDQAAIDVNAPPPDFLSHSHGEGFLRFFEERGGSQGIFIFDEPESALSPSRQLAFLKLIGRMERSGRAQIIMATHAPMLMAYPGATLLAAGPRGFERTSLEDTSHYKLTRAFAGNPHDFIARIIGGVDED